MRETHGQRQREGGGRNERQTDGQRERERRGRNERQTDRKREREGELFVILRPIQMRGAYQDNNNSKTRRGLERERERGRGRERERVQSSQIWASTKFANLDSTVSELLYVHRNHQAY